MFSGFSKPKKLDKPIEGRTIDCETLGFSACDLNWADVIPDKSTIRTANKIIFFILTPFQYLINNTEKQLICQQSWLFTIEIFRLEIKYPATLNYFNKFLKKWSKVITRGIILILKY